MQTASAAQLADRPDKLTTRTKMGFGVADLGGNLFFTIGGFYFLNFLTENLGLSAGLAGTALMIGKIWDAVTDPACGYLSDRTRTRWGRRRPYMAVGAVFLFIFMILMFTNPRIQTDMLLFVWVVVIYCLLNTAYTLINIPYGALTPEMTGDYDERTSLNGYRMSFAVVGTLIGAGAMLPLVSVFSGIFDNESIGWTVTGGLMGFIMATATMITVLSVKEKLGAPVTKATNVFKSYIQVLGMKTFLLALIPWTFHITGVNVIQASLLYFFQNIYRNEGMFSIALLFLLVSSLAFIPVWVKISAKIGKKKSYNIGMLIVAAMVLVFAGFGPSLPIWFSFIIMGLAGTGFATQYVMPFSIVPDVVEYDFAENGKRREGVFYGMWTFSSKIGQSIGIAMTGWILTAFGYQEPTAAVPDPVQTADAVIGIRILTGPVPALLFICGAIILSFYPITRQKYDEIMVKVAEREKANGAEGE